MKLALIPVAGAFDRAVNALEGLPGSPGKIASFLADIGIDGYCGSANNCPLAVYLQDYAGPDHRSDLTVSAMMLRVKTHPLVLEHALPDHVSSFVTRFDFGLYPQLIRRSQYTG